MQQTTELVYCSSTGFGRPFEEKVEAAALAGFQGVSITLKDYTAARERGMTDADLLAVIRSSGLFIAEVSAATRWLHGTSSDDEELGIHLVTRLGGRGQNCTTLDAPFRDVDSAVAAFQGICDRVGRRGIRCHIEFVPWTAPRNLLSCWEIVQRANRSNGGMMLDTFHLYRSGGSASDLRAIAADKIFGVQLADAPVTPRYPDQITHTPHRLLPGQGAADIVACIQVLDEIGVNVPLGGEVPNSEWSDRPALDGAKTVYAAMVDVLFQARSLANEG